MDRLAGRSTWSLDELLDWVFCWELSVVRRIALTTDTSRSASVRHSRSVRWLGRLRSTKRSTVGARVRRFSSIKCSSAPARSSLYAAARDGDVTLRPGRGIMFGEQERALEVSSGYIAGQMKTPLGQVLVVPLIARLTTDWSCR